MQFQPDRPRRSGVEFAGIFLFDTDTDADIDIDSDEGYHELETNPPSILPEET
jgi:hypothetical protein